MVAKASWVKLIVTSRDEPQIRASFGNVRTAHNLFEDEDATEHDLRLYFCHRVQHCEDENPKNEHGELDYLLKYEDAFAATSGGLFIWMYTALTLIIKSMRRDKLVDSLLSRSTIEGVVDRMAALYLTVLENACQADDNVRDIVRMIVGLLVVTASSAPFSISGLYAFVPPSLSDGLRLKDFAHIVMRLNLVLKLTFATKGYSDVSKPRNPVSAPHRYLVQAYDATFLEFSEKKDLRLEETRGSGTVESNGFWTNPVSLHRNMTMGCFEIMLNGTRSLERDDHTHSGLRFNICELNTPYRLNREVVDFEKTCYVEHPCRTPVQRVILDGTSVGIICRGRSTGERGRL